MVASYIVAGDSFRPEKPRVWFQGRFPALPNARAFDLHPDGRRAVVLRSPPAQSEHKQDNLVFILNFFEYLRRIATEGIEVSIGSARQRGRQVLRPVQELLGQERIQTTAIYTSLDLSDLRTALEKCHPRERGLRKPA